MNRPNSAGANFATNAHMAATTAPATMTVFLR